MDAHDLLRITLALVRDADLPTEEKIAVLESAAIVIRDTAGLDEAARGLTMRGSQAAHG
jgi:hypothetical protein